MLSLDSHKLLFHLDRLNRWQKGEEIYPIYVAISPSGNCTHKCVFCAYEYLQNQNVYFKKEALLRLLNEFKEIGVKSIFYSGEGEPFLNKDLPEIIEKTASAGIDCAVNTNGLLFTKEIAERILKCLTFVRVSLNAGSSETYRIVHKTPPESFDRVLRNIKDIADVRKKQGIKTTIGVQCVVINENLNELVILAKKMREAGADYLALKPFLAHPKISYRLNFRYDEPKVISLLEEAERISGDNFRVFVRWDSFNKLKKRDYKKCLSLPFMVEIDCRGDVYPCGPLLGDRRFVYGNIYQNSFREVWHSRQCRKAMDSVYNELNVNECMPNCRNDSVNRFLWQLDNKPEHVNFI